MAGPLTGIKVVGFDWIVIGPLGTSYLGDYGATVVKVESHIRPDGGRFVGPFKGGITNPDSSGFFTHQNSSKYSVTINLRHDSGRKLALELIKWADVVEENMAPGVMQRLGLDYEKAREVNPQVIYLGLSLVGKTGPSRNLAGFGQLAGALGGVTHLSGWPDRISAPPHGAYTDYLTARFIPIIVLAALQYRKRTGKGQFIDMSVFENTAYLMSLPVMDYVINERVWDRTGNRHPRACPHGVFQCEGDDRWVAITVFTDEEWQAFCQALDKPELATDPKYSGIEERKRNEDELEKLIAAWTINHNAENIESIMQNAGIAASVVESAADLFSDPQLKFRDGFRSLSHAEMGSVIRAAPASKFSKTPDVQFGPPALGEHNMYVLEEFLHLSENEIADLYAEGAITTEADYPF
jgi:crotonobetainyl-CoA:carnitine CoA-transferase CaiB-like acyl-CoA transferase